MAISETQAIHMLNESMPAAKIVKLGTLLDTLINSHNALIAQINAGVPADGASPAITPLPMLGQF